MQFSISYILYKQNKEIDAYYDEKYRAAAKLKAELAQKRIHRQRRREVTLLVTATLVLCSVFFLQLHMRQDIKVRQAALSDLSLEINDLHQSNLDKEKRLYSDIDLKKIRKQAEKLGMTRAQEKNICFYKLRESEYMFSLTGLK